MPRPLKVHALPEGAAVRVRIARDPFHAFDRAISTATITPEAARELARTLLAAADSAEAPKPEAQP